MIALPTPSSANESNERIFEKVPFNPRYATDSVSIKILLVTKFINSTASLRNKEVLMFLSEFDVLVIFAPLP